jgi:hypothetical protein
VECLLTSDAVAGEVKACLREITSEIDPLLLLEVRHSYVRGETSLD